MGNWLKGLIAAACCVAIAGGAGYAYDRIASAKAEDAEVARKEDQKTLGQCSDFLFEFDARKTGQHPNRQAVVYRGNLVDMSDAELRVRLQACAEKVPEFAERIDEMLNQ